MLEDRAVLNVAESFASLELMLVGIRCIHD